jgi:DNA-binding HxlR family transcriptional regulator
MGAPGKAIVLRGKTHRCFFELALAVIGGKWKPLIIRFLGRAGIMRFSELHRSITGITERMLARQLRELEADGVVRREVYREIPSRVEYSLTQLGCGLTPILDQLKNWGEQCDQSMSEEELFTGGGYEPRVNGN